MNLPFNDEQKKGNFRGKCIYLLMLIKQKNVSVWEKLKKEFGSLKSDQSYEFYQKLMEELKNLQNPSASKKESAEAKKEGQKNNYRILKAHEKVAGQKEREKKLEQRSGPKDDSTLPPETEKKEKKVVKKKVAKKKSVGKKKKVAKKKVTKKKATKKKKTRGR